MSDTISIAGLDKAKVLCALHNSSSRCRRPITEDFARDLLADHQRINDLGGVPVRTDLSKDVIYVGSYDREHGTGAAERALKGAGLIT